MKELTVNEVKEVSGAMKDPGGYTTNMLAIAAGAFGSKLFPGTFSGAFIPAAVLLTFGEFIIKPQLEMTKEDV